MKVKYLHHISNIGNIYSADDLATHFAGMDQAPL